MPPPPSALLPFQFHSVHGAGVKILKKLGTAKTNEDNTQTSAYGQGFLFSDRSIKVGEKVCLQILELSHDSKVRLGFTKTSPDSFPKSLLGYANKGATIQNAECWLQDARTSSVEFKPKSKIAYSVHKGGDVILEINGVDKGLIASEVDTSGGQLWAVIDLTGPDVQIQPLGIKEVPVIIVNQLPSPSPQQPINVPVVKDTSPSAWNATPVQKQKKGPSGMNARNRSKQPSTLNRFDSLMASEMDAGEMAAAEETSGHPDTSKGSSNPRKRGKKKGQGQQDKNKSQQDTDEDNSFVVVYIIILMVFLIGVSLALFWRK